MLKKMKGFPFLRRPMFFHLIMTRECNMQCTYCYGEAIKDTETEFDDRDIDYNLPKCPIRYCVATVTQCYIRSSTTNRLRRVQYNKNQMKEEP